MSISSKQREITDIKGLISSLDRQIDLTQSEINSALNKIDLATRNIEMLKSDISKKQKEIEEQKKNLHETVRAFYEIGNQTTIEMVVGSDSLSEAVDRAQYFEAISSRIDEQVKAINKAKSDLESKKTALEKDRLEIEKTRASLEQKKKGLGVQMGQKNSLLGQTVAEKGRFQDDLNQLMKDRSRISAEIYALRMAKGDIILDGSSDYPFQEIDVPDPWGFLTRECTSYAAWYWNVKLGKRFTNTLKRGSAWNWPALGRDQGYTVSDTPKVGAIISWRASTLTSQWGHVAIVEKVYDDGTIDLSEFNWKKYRYTYRVKVNPGDYGPYSYIY